MAQPSSPWDWLGQPAFQQQGGLPPAIMQQAGVPQTSRLAAIGQMLMGLGQGANQRAAQGGGLFSQLASGAASGAGALMGARDQEREQTMQSLLQQATIAKAMRPEGGGSEFQSLLSSVPEAERPAYIKGRLGALASESQQETYREPTPEELTANPGLSQISSTGKKVFQPSEMVVSPVEEARLSISARLAEGTLTQAQATREMAAATAAAAQAQRDIENKRSETERTISGDRNLREDRDSLRTEVMTKSPAISQARAAAPFLHSIEAAAKVPGTMSDLDITYAVAKIFDPTSVVRETEQGMVLESASGSPLPAWLIGAFNKSTTQQGISDDMRKDIVRQARTRIKSYVEAAKPDVSYYTDLARQRGYEPGDILPNMPTVSDAPIEFGAPPPPAAPAPLVQPPGTGVNLGPGLPPLPPGFVMGQ